MSFFRRKKKKKEKEAEARSEEKVVDKEEKKDPKTESEDSVRAKEKTEKKVSSTKKKQHIPLQALRAHEVLLSPRITEKATYLSGDNIYTFNVHPDANKKEVEKAVEVVYNVKPEKVRITKVPRKRVFSRRGRGVKSGGKKAYVYLKEEDSIELI